MPPATQLHLPLPAPQPGAEGADSLPDRLCALIVRRGRPLEVGHVAAQLLRLRRCPERLQRRLVAEIVEGDARLAWLGRDLVGLAPPDWSSAGLGSATFCVVNLETTGGSPGLLQGHRDRRRAGPRRGGRRPVRDARQPEPADPPGGHRAHRHRRRDGRREPGHRGGAGGVRGLRRPGRAGRPQRALRPALPQLRAPPPGEPLLHPALARHARARATAARRPGAAARPAARWRAGPTRRCGPSTARCRTPRRPPRCWSALLGLLAERGVNTLERAVAFGGSGGARHAYKLALAEELPTLPGVYLMRDRRGGALYVGKAADLRRRVRAYFGPGRPPRAPHRTGARAARVDRPRGVRVGVRGAPARERPHQGAQPAVQPARRGRGRAVPQDQPRRAGAAPLRRPARRWPTARPTSGRSARSAWPGRRSPACTRSTPSGAQDPAARDAALAEVELLLGRATPARRAGSALRIAEAVADGRLDDRPGRRRRPRAGAARRARRAGAGAAGGRGGRP